MKHIFNILMMAFVAACFFALLVFVEEELILPYVIVPPPNVTLTAWLHRFREWGEIVIWLSFAGSLSWYGLGQYFFKVDSWQASNKRPVWIALFLIPPIGVIVGLVFTAKVQAGALYVYGLYFANGPLSYYLETVLFSPSSFMFTPWGATKVRRWV